VSLAGQSLRLVGNARGTTTTITNDNGQTLSFNLSGLNAAAGLSVFLAGDGGGEMYGLQSMTVTADFITGTAAAVPVPSGLMLGLLGLGGLWFRRRKRR